MGNHTDIEMLHKKVDELEKANTKLLKERSLIDSALQERIKELNCLYKLSEVVDKYDFQLNLLLQNAVELLPISWQYPEDTCARIIIEDEVYATEDFNISKWKQSSEIKIAEYTIGLVEVYYLKKHSTLDEGPFLKEERLLINAFADKVGRSMERIKYKQQLELEKDTAMKANIALKEVLSKTREASSETEQKIRANVVKIINPIIHSLESSLPTKNRAELQLLKNNLDEIVSPFVNKVSHDFASLTPLELQICNMVMQGLSSKEIANIRGIEPTTVNRHRENIRKKLGLSNKKVNLASFLASHIDKSSEVI